MRVKSFKGFAHPRSAYVRIDLRGLNRRVTEKLLDRSNVGAVIEQMGCKAVPEHVRANLEAGARGCAVNDCPYRATTERRSADWSLAWG